MSRLLNLRSRASREALAGRRGVWLALALLSCIYVAFVAFTHASSYGLTLQPDGHLTWVATRLLTFSLWLALAALLVGVRRTPIAWRSFAYAFLATCGLAVAIASALVPASESYVSIAGTIGMYALASGFVCITVARPLHALALGALLFPIQLLVDVTGHFLSGQFRLH
jgi:hypothetical protein